MFNIHWDESYFILFLITKDYTVKCLPPQYQKKQQLIAIKRLPRGKEYFQCPHPEKRKNPALICSAVHISKAKQMERFPSEATQLAH